MSLIDPTIWSKYKWLFIAGGLIVILLLSWWGLHSYDTYRENKKIANMKANVAIALQEVANAQSNVNKDTNNEAAAVQHLKDVTNEYTTAVNATEAQRFVTNQAIANVEKAINANVPVNTNAEDIHRLLDQIDNNQP